jgi:hypothetical protein
MKKFIEKLFFKISKIFKNFMQFIIFGDVIKYLKSSFYRHKFEYYVKILPLILKRLMRMGLCIISFNRDFCKDNYLIKNFQEFYLHFSAIFFGKYAMSIKEFFQKKYKQLIFKKIFPKSILTRFKRLYFAIFVDFFYRQKSASTRIFLAYFYNLFYVNCKN